MNWMEKAVSKVEALKIEHFFRSGDGGNLPYLRAMRETADWVIICLCGPIDSSTVPIVSMDLQGKLKRYLDKHILLDFKEVTHVDSATVANLIFLLNQLQHSHRKLAVIHVSSVLENYIDIDKVRPLIHVYENEEEAIKALDGTGS